MFSKEILPLEYTKEFIEVVSNNSKFVGLFKPNSRAALEIAVDALIAGLVVFIFCETSSEKDKFAFFTCPSFIAKEELELNISIPYF